MTIDALTAQWIGGLIITAIGAHWGYSRWLDGRFDAMAKEIDQVRNDCVRREELAQLHVTLNGLTRRMDDLLLAVRAPRAAE